MIEIVEIAKSLTKDRMDKGITLEEIADSSKLSLTFLKRIDRCDSLHTISHIYLRTYLRQYALYLKNDNLVKQIDKLLPSFKSNMITNIKNNESNFKSPTIHISKTAEAPVSQRPLPFMKILIIFALLACLVLAFKGCSHIKLNGIFHKSTKLVEKTDTKSNKTTKTKKEKKSSKPKKIPQKTIKETENEIQINQSSFNSTSSAQPYVSIITKNNVFVQVKTDGSLIFKSLLLKGSQESWSADEKIEIRINNPSQVLLDIMGKQVPTKNSKKPVTYTITPKGFFTKK